MKASGWQIVFDKKFSEYIGTAFNVSPEIVIENYRTLDIIFTNTAYIFKNEYADLYNIDQQFLLVIFNKALQHTVNYLTNKRNDSSFSESKIEINFATDISHFSTLKLNGKLIRQIIDNRNERGFYKNETDFKKRILGIGAVIIQKVRNHLSFTTIPSVTFTNNKIPDNIQTIKLLLNKLIAASFIDLLGVISTITSNEPNPVSIYHIPVKQTRFPGIVVNNFNKTEFIFNNEYFPKASLLIDEALSSINLCMFHISFTKPENLVYKLLTKLIERKKAGVNVRVLLDADREDDPYLSTIINTPTLIYLKENGVECKFDSSNKLLHSKFITIDSHISIVGSHNWTIGSLDKFDDLSVIIDSSEFNITLQERFNKLWDGN